MLFQIVPAVCILVLLILNYFDKVTLSVYLLRTFWLENVRLKSLVVSTSDGHFGKQPGLSAGSPLTFVDLRWFGLSATFGNFELTSASEVNCET